MCLVCCHALRKTLLALSVRRDKVHVDCLMTKSNVASADPRPKKQAGYRVTLYTSIIIICFSVLLHHNHFRCIIRNQSPCHFRIRLLRLFNLSVCVSSAGTEPWRPGAECRGWASLCSRSRRSCPFGCCLSSWPCRRPSGSTWSTFTAGTKPYAPAC